MQHEVAETKDLRTCKRLLESQFSSFPEHLFFRISVRKVYSEGILSKGSIVGGLIISPLLIKVSNLDNFDLSVG